MKKVFTMSILAALLFSVVSLNAVTFAYETGNNYTYEKEVLDIEKQLATLEINTIEYLKLEISMLEKQKAIFKNSISDITKLYINEETGCLSIKYCDIDRSTQAMIDLYNEKITLKDKEISVKEQLLKEKKIEEKDRLRQEELRLKLEEERVLLEQSKEVAKSYLKEGLIEEEQGNYKSALVKYDLSCKSFKTYECYLGIGKMNYELAKNYYKKRAYYWHEALAKKKIEKAREALNSALGFGLEDVQKKEIKELLEVVEWYKDKEESKKAPMKKNNLENTIKKDATSIEEQDKNTILKKKKIEKKVELIVKRLELITTKYSPDKKKALYAKLLSSLEKYKLKTKDWDLKDIIVRLIEHFEGYIK